VWFRFEDCLNIDRPRYIHDSKFVFGDGVFIILFCSIRGSISQNTGTLKCWKEVHQYCSVSNQTSCIPCIGYTKVHANMAYKRPLYFLICS
jgi:hypothetical protein